MKRSAACAMTGTQNLPSSRARRTNQHRLWLRRGALRIALLGEVGCLIALVVLILAVLVGTGSVDEAALRQMASAESNGSPAPDLREPICRMAVAADSGTVLLRTGWNRLECLKLRTGELLDLAGLEAAGAAAVSQSAEGRVIAVGYSDGSVRFRIDGDSALKAADEQAGAVNDLRLSADGRFAVSSSHDGLVLVWDIRNGGVVHRLNVTAGPENSATLATLSHDGEFVAAGTRDGSICCWRTADGRLAAQFAFPGFSSLAFSHDAKSLLVTNLHERSIHRFDVSSGREQWKNRSPGPSGAVGYSCVDASPDGGTVAAGDLCGAIDVFDVESGDLLDQVPAHDSTVSSLQFSPDGRLLFSASYDGTVAVWETQGFTEAIPRIETGRLK